MDAQDVAAIERKWAAFPIQGQKNVLTWDKFAD